MENSKNNQPEHYSFKLLEDSSVYLGILVPENNNKAEELSAMVISINPPLSSVPLRLDGKDFIWTKYYEEFAGDNYFKGPDIKKELGAGEYTIVVTSRNNIGKYVLVIGEKESFSFNESIKTLLRLPALKMVFFETSFFTIFSGIIGKGILILIVLILLMAFGLYKLIRFLVKR